MTLVGLPHPEMVADQLSDGPERCALGLIDRSATSAVFEVVSVGWTEAAGR